MVSKEEVKLIQSVSNLIYDEFGLKTNVVTNARNRDIVDAKNLIIYITKRMTGLSFRKLTDNTPLVDRKISANRHGCRLIASLIKDTKEFEDKLNEINKVISLTPSILDKYKDKYFYKPEVKYIDVLTTRFGDHMIILPTGDKLICIDYPNKPEMIGREVNIAQVRLKPMKYRPELSPLSDNYFFKEYIKYNRL